MDDSEGGTGKGTMSNAHNVDDKTERQELIQRMYREARELDARLKKNERLTAEDLAVRVNLSV